MEAPGGRVKLHGEEHGVRCRKPSKASRIKTGEEKMKKKKKKRKKEGLHTHTLLAVNTTTLARVEGFLGTFRIKCSRKGLSSFPTKYLASQF